MILNMTEVKIEAPALTAENNEKEQKLRSPNGGRRRNKKDEAKREFIKFVTELRKQYGEDVVTFQISNHPVGLEFSLRVDKKEIKELAEEQKAKRAEKQAKRREYVEKKRQEKLENNAGDENGKELPTGIAVG